MSSVTAVLLNWNGKRYLQRCIGSLMRQTFEDFDVVFVDNASTDGSVQYVKDTFPDINVLELSKNKGTTGGYNEGINYAVANGTRYIWIMNTDTIVDKETLAELVNVARSDRKIGVVGSKIYFSLDKDRIWFAGGIIHKVYGTASHIGRDVKDIGQFNQIREVDYITGCGIFIRRELVEDIGLFDERLFMYFEDVDFCFRAKKKHWKIVFTPKSKMWHQLPWASERETDRPPLADYYDTRNGLYFIRKNVDPKYVPLAIAFFLCRIIRKTMRILVRKETQKKDKLKNIVIGIRDYRNMMK